MAAEPEAEPIATLEALTGRPLPANVRQELNGWAGHSEKFILYEGFALLEGQRGTAVPHPHIVETISPNLALVRRPEELYRHLEAAEQVPSRIRHEPAALAAPTTVKSCLAPAVPPRHAAAKKTVRLIRVVQTTLRFADADAHAAFTKILLDAKCVVPIDRRALTISYPRKAEPQVKQCLKQFEQQCRVDVEEVDGP